MSAKRKQSQPKQSRTAKKQSTTPTNDADKTLRAKMSAHFSGSDVSPAQLAMFRKYVSRKFRSGILKTLKCSEAQLRRYADSDISLSDLPERTREILAEMSEKPAYKKPWPKKSAAMLYETHMSRKRASRPKSSKTETPTPTES